MTWIDATKEKPPNPPQQGDDNWPWSTDVLVWLAEAHECAIGCYNPDHGGAWHVWGWSHQKELPLPTVTHWQYLPGPPQ